MREIFEVIGLVTVVVLCLGVAGWLAGVVKVELDLKKVK